MNTNSMEKLKKCQLPPKEMFYSTSNDLLTTDEDYGDAQHV